MGGWRRYFAPVDKYANPNVVNGFTGSAGSGHVWETVGQWDTGQGAVIVDIM